MRLSHAALWLLVSCMFAAPAHSQDLSDEVAELRQLVAGMRADYEARITDLETRLARAERQVKSAGRDAEEAIELAEQTAIDQTAGSSAPNAFNPGIGAILTGTYASVDSGWDEIPGFQPGGEIGTAESGFGIAEAEVNLKASVDARFFGNLTLGIGEDDGEVELEIEEASLQTTALPAGLTLQAGRFFSSAGYLNSFHFHADDFVDRPLPYQAFLGGRYAVDGVQARWVAPTSLLFELGTELNWGGGFPATANEDTSPGAWTAFAKLGGDVGTSNAWQLGLAYIHADATDRAAVNHGQEEGGAAGEPGAFTGDSYLTLLDFVWKWAPGGNPNVRNFKVQGEFFRRSEDGLFDDVDYSGDQSGWYLQGVWQFSPLWRVGLRYDAVDADSGPLLDGTELEDPGRSSDRSSLMVDYSPSEFSRLRLQYTNDGVLDETDHQWMLQYIMSLGAHGAHQF